MKKVFSLLVFCTFSFFLPAQNIYDLEHSFKYAEHLFTSEKFENAAKEYERLLFFFPENDSIIFSLSRSYLHARQFDKALSLIEGKTKDEKTGILYLNLLLLSKQFEKAKTNALSTDKLPENEKEKFNGRFMLYSEENKGYANIITPVTGISDKEKLLFQEAKNFTPKKPAVALGLSVIPGLGKVYTGHYGDASMTFLTVGICSFLAYRGYQKKGFESIPGWFYGTLGTGLYLGNFYGSFKSAKTRTARFRDRIRTEIEEIIISEN